MGVRFGIFGFVWFFFEEPGDNSFFYLGHQKEARLDFASLWADPCPTQHDL